MNTTENTKVWEAPVLIIELLESTESGMSNNSTENSGSQYAPTSV
jgi:hypothetical protein